MNNNYILLALSVCLGLGLQTNAQTVFQENFDTGIPGTWLTIDVDGLPVHASVAQFTSAWIGAASFSNSTDTVAMSTSWYNPVGTSDDWLISPQMALTDSNILTWEENAPDVNFPDGYEVRISTTTQTITGFMANPPLLTVPAASGAVWMTQAIDLAAAGYSNQNIYLAWRNTSTDQFILMIDDILVGDVPDVGVLAAASPLSGGRIGTSSELSSTETIEVTIQNFGTSAVGSIPVFYSINGGTPVSGVSSGLESDSTINYIFPTTADLSAVGSYEISVWTAMNLDSDSSNDTLVYTIAQVANPAVGLPFCVDFEDVTADSVTGLSATMIGAFGLDYLDISSEGPRGRFRTNAGPGYYHTGSKALTMDVDPSGAVVANTADMVLNLSDYDVNTDDVVIDMWFMSHEDELHPGDKIWIKGSEFDTTWIVLADWHSFTGGANGQYFSVNDLIINAPLLSGGQSFSTTTTIRVGQEDNFPSTSISASDGLTVDDFCLSLLADNDYGPIALDAFSTCGDDSTVVCATIQNHGTQTQDFSTVTLNWSNNLGGSGTLIANSFDTLAYTEAATVCFDPINTLNGGTYTFEVITDLLGDTAYHNDTLMVSGIEYRSVHIPSFDTVWVCPDGSEICITDMALDTTQTYSWFATDTSSTAMFTGPTICLDSITNNTAVYVEAINGSVTYVGAPDTTIGLGTGYAIYSTGLRFNALNDVQIQELTVYPADTGNVVVRILDSLQNVIDSAVVGVSPSFPFESTVITANLTVPAGEGYTMDAAGSTVTQLYRNSSGAGYPYTDPGNNIEIYLAGNTLSDYYYFFYNWKIGSSCASERVCVPIIQGSNLVGDFNSNISDFTVGFSDATSGSPTSWNWSFGDGITSTQQNPVHTYAFAGTYTACLVVSTACDSDTICETITLLEPCDNPTGQFVSNIQGTQVTVSWDAEPNAISYKLRSRKVGTSNWVVNTILAPSTSKVKTNLEPNSEYEYQLKTICSENSPVGYGALGYFTTGDFPCDNPTVHSVTGITSTGATMHWNPVPNVNKYKVKIRVVGTTAWSFHTIYEPDTLKVRTGLLPGTDYEYKVKTFCDFNTPLSWGAMQYFTTLDECGDPTGLTVTDIEAAQATISWNAVAGALSYKLRVREVGTSNWLYNTIVAPTTMKVRTNLQPNTDYQYSLKTICSDGSSTGYGPNSNFTTLDYPCDNPSIITAGNIEATQATILWDAQPNAVKYKVKVRETGTTTWDFHTIWAPTTFKVKTGLTPGTDYEYKVKTVCSLNSPLSWNGFFYFTTTGSEPGARLTSNDVDQSINVFPNPTTGSVTVVLGDADQATVVVRNVHGQVVSRKAVSGSSRIELDIDGAAGLYSVEVITEAGLNEVFRIVKE